MPATGGGNGHFVWEVWEGGSYVYKYGKLTEPEQNAVRDTVLNMAAERVLPGLQDKRDMMPPGRTVYRRHIPEVDLWLLYDVPKNRTGVLLLCSIKRGTDTFWF